MVGEVALTATNILAPLLTLWENIVGTVPGILAAVIVLLVGYIIAWAVSYVLEHILDKIQFDKWIVQETHMTKHAGDLRLGHFLAIMTRWFVFILFWPGAADLVRLDSLANFLQAVAFWLPKAIGAVAVGIVGFVAAEYSAWRVSNVKGKAAGVLADITKWVLLVVTAFVVLRQIGINIDFAENSLLIVLAGIMLAIGLAFGLGGKEAAKSIVNQVSRKL